MSLYLCVFDGDTELAAVEVGGYDDFGRFREAVAMRVEQGSWGSRFPTLMNQPDADGEWSFPALRSLRQEVATMIDNDALAEFTDIDGVPLTRAILALTDAAIASHRPILFQ